MWLTGRPLDLSIHGLFVSTSQIFPPGTQISLILQGLGNRPLLVHGVVNWARATGVSGMGIVFENLGPADLTLLNAATQLRRSSSLPRAAR